MNSEFLQHIRALTPLIQFVTSDELTVLPELLTCLERQEEHLVAHHPVYGAGPLRDLLVFRRGNRPHAGVRPEALLKEPRMIHRRPETWNTCPIGDFLCLAIEDNPRPHPNFYVILDADQYLENPKVVSLLREIVLQDQDSRTVKVVILLTSTSDCPKNLKSFIQMVVDTGPTPEQTQKLVEGIAGQLEIAIPTDVVAKFGGFTALELRTVMTLSILNTKSRKIHPLLVLDDLETLNNFRQTKGLMPYVPKDPE